MANVTATDRMKDDPRFDTAGVLMGVEGDLVRYRMIRLWSWQTEHYTPEAPTYVVSRVSLVGMFRRPDAPEALVAAELAEECPGGFYIKGTEGVIEWLWKKKAAGAKGYAEKAKRCGAQAVPKQTLDDTGGGAPVVSSPCDPGSGIRDPEKNREESGSATPALVLALDLPAPVKPPDAVQVATVAAITRLNLKTGRRFDAGAASVAKDVRACLKAGLTVDDLLAIVDDRCAAWLDSTKRDELLKPSVLFRPSNAQRYLAESRAGPTTTAPRATGPAPATFRRITEDEIAR